jgi:hypothetical protein
MEIRCADFRFHFLTTGERVGAIGASSAVRGRGLHQSRHPKKKGEDRGAEADTAMQKAMKETIRAVVLFPCICAQIAARRTISSTATRIR